MEREREHLAHVDRHIAECQSHIARQREIIQDAVEQGHPADLAGGCCASWKKVFVPSGGTVK